MQSPVKTKFFNEDGTLIVNRSQDVQSILDFCKERQIDGYNRRSDLRLAGSIPLVLAEQWSRECGARLGSKEFMEYAKKKLMSGEFGKLIANGF